MSLASRPRPQRAAQHPREAGSLKGLGWLLASELAAGLVGFGVMVHFARRLGPEAFGRLEFAVALAAWLLVVVRSGIEQIVYREAARRPRLIGPLTDQLLGLKCLGALAGYALIAGLALAIGPEGGPLVAMAGLILVPSALVADVGPRARGELAAIAAAQALRTMGYAAWGWCLVRGPDHALRAAWCGVVGEGMACLFWLSLHARDLGLPRPGLRRRAWAVLARRGLIASLTRFGRVGLYGADLLVLGGWMGRDLGPYAVARRIVLALAALGLVVPGAVAPAIARAWALGPDRARALIRTWTAGLLAASLPAAVGLAVTAERWMPVLFGPGYRGGGPLLAITAARLPWLLLASFDQAALVACRRETIALRLVLGLVLLALIVVPISAAWGGPAVVGLAVLAVEVAGTVAGWASLDRLGVAPCWHHEGLGAIAGSLALLIICLATPTWPLVATCLLGAIAYAATWGTMCRLLGDGMGTRMLQWARA
ncbi:MAG: oligosaccharide flippase family protein [Isosphaeraceae bacterium]|nr:oligosaccharide flippase family protein [Isosphaeraceae bacterium]